MKRKKLFATYLQRSATRLVAVDNLNIEPLLRRFD